MKKLLVIFFLVLALSFLFGVKLAKPSKEKEKQEVVIAPSQFESQALFLVNEYRKENGLRELAIDAGLCDFAKARANEIISDWSHDSFFGRGKEYCKACFHFGENLGRYFFSPEDVLLGWKKSKTHNQNLLDDLFNIGCVSAIEKPEGYYIALILGTI